MDITQYMQSSENYEALIIVNFGKSNFYVTEFEGRYELTKRKDSAKIYTNDLDIIKVQNHFSNKNFSCANEESKIGDKVFDFITPALATDLK
jgi:hypothetical protein